MVIQVCVWSQATHVLHEASDGEGICIGVAGRKTKDWNEVSEVAARGVSERVSERARWLNGEWVKVGESARARRGGV